MGTRQLQKLAAEDLRPEADPDSDASEEASTPRNAGNPFGMLVRCDLAKLPRHAWPALPAFAKLVTLSCTPVPPTSTADETWKADIYAGR